MSRDAKPYILPKLDPGLKPGGGKAVTSSSPIYIVARRIQQAFSKISNVTPAYTAEDMSLDPASAREARTRQLNANGSRKGSPRPHRRASEFSAEKTVIPLEDITDSNTGSELSGPASFTVFCPSIFAHIRSLYSFNDESILKEFAQAQSLGFLPSPGKSPTIFLYGGSGRFIVKQLKSKELRYLLACAHAYAEHLSMYPNTLIIRLLGVFTISLKGKNFNLCIMPNLFDTPLPISRRYDIKGSFVGRSTKHPKEGSTLKDNDLRHNISLDARRRWLLLSQLELDSEFFARWNFIDYSLLLGEALWPGDKSHCDGQEVEGATPVTKHPLPQVDPEISSLTPLTMNERPCSESIFLSEMGGYICDPHPEEGRSSSSGYAVIYLGVIDFLTDYNWFKTMETALKGIRNDKHGVSAVPAREYKERFMRAVREVFVVSTGYEVEDVAEGDDGQAVSTRRAR